MRFDREVPPDLAQEVDVVERIEPVGVVGHDGVAGPIAEFQEFLEHAADAGEIAADILVGEDLAALVLAGRIAHARGAAAHQRNRAVPGLLHPVEHHDRQQRAHMQGGRSAVEPDIGRDLAVARARCRAPPARRPGG